MVQRRCGVLALVLAMSLAGCAGFGTESQAQTSLSQGLSGVGLEDPTGPRVGRVVPGVFGPQNGKIAFTSDRSGRKQIWIMNADGSNQTQLTSAYHAAQQPTWSRDGTKIAFIGTWESPALAYTGRAFTDQLYVMNADGSNQRLLTTEWFTNYQIASTENSPTWSPDGQWIAFQGHSLFHRPLFKPAYLIRVDGSGLTRLPDGRHNLDWSADGKRFVYDRNGTGISIVNAPPTNLGPGSDAGTIAPATNVTSTPGDEFPSWSPDGQRIVLNRAPLGAGGPRRVFVMNVDGTAMTRLSDNTFDQTPVWSPDGTKIAFSGRGDINNEDILVMNPDGTGRTRVTTDAGFDYQPSWQAGRRLIGPVLDSPLIKDVSPAIGSQAVAPALTSAACLFGLDLPWTC